MASTVSRHAMWGIRGKVVHGHGRGGSQLGFPTANIQLDNKTIELLAPFVDGVYFGWASVEPTSTSQKKSVNANGSDNNTSGIATSAPAVVHPMVMSVGFNPHFKDQACTVEVHFIHKFEQDFYDSTIRVVTCDILRDMTAFTTLEALIEMIKDDIRQAKEKLLGEFAPWQRAAFLSQDAPALAEDGLPSFHLPLTSPQQLAKF